jgi:hypothetical protein
MKPQGILMNGLGPLLARMLSERGSEVDQETSSHAARDASRKKSGEGDISGARRGDAPTSPGVVIGGAEDAAKAQTSQLATINPGPALVLLAMLRNRRPRSHRTYGRELGLPRGCVLAARYTSR